MTQFDIGNNELTGAIPTQIGMLTKIVTAADEGFLSLNELTGETIPTELGALTGMTDGDYFLCSSKLGGTVPTELGRMSEMSSRFALDANSLSSSIPTQLGQLTEMTHVYHLYSNQLCSDVPTEVQALSSGITGWQVTTGNDIGTVSSQLTHPTRQPSDSTPFLPALLRDAPRHAHVPADTATDANAIDGANTLVP